MRFSQAIKCLLPLAGGLPRKQQKYVEAWVALREDEINAALIAINESSEVIKIKGLEG
ncbi:MAG: DUF4160 domain-containing protein [Clostridiales bacterium]|nr:DUF4160 domain-containing protein [Clostridiales bacterium]